MKCLLQYKLAYGIIRTVNVNFFSNEINEKSESFSIKAGIFQHLKMRGKLGRTCGAVRAASIRYFASGVLAVEWRALDALRADDLAAVLALALLAPEPRPRVPGHVGDVVRLTTITHV